MENKSPKTKITTLKIDTLTKTRLDRLKEHEKESYNQVIKKLLHIINVFRRNPALGHRLLNHIDKTAKIRTALKKSLDKL